ncbi:MAG: FHA domain-containing protein [Myxococcaceae bacterium]
MSVRLLIRQRSEEGGTGKPEEVVLDAPVMTLGRDKSCQVVLSQQAVSRTHARITQEGVLCFVEDLGSSFGTLVNGRPLPKGEKRLLRNGDTLAIAQYDLSFERVPEAMAPTAKTGQLARSLLKDAIRGSLSGVEPYLRVMNGDEEGRRIMLADAREWVFGRDEGVDIVLRDDLVSRRHAKVRRDWSGTHVEDLESRNGIRVNRKRVSRRTLKDGDEVEIGGTRLLFVDPAALPDAEASMPSARLNEIRRTTPPPGEEDPPTDEAGAADTNASQSPAHAGAAEQQPSEEELETSESDGETEAPEDDEADDGPNDEGVELPPENDAFADDGEVGDDGADEAPTPPGTLTPQQIVLMAGMAVVALGLVGLVLAILIGA